MKKCLILLCAVLILAATFTGCTTIYAETLQENENVSVVYEAFFLNNDEIRNLFAEIRGPDAPYAIMTANLHVTTAFIPQKDMHEFYGTSVNVHIYAYQAGEVCADDGNMTANEGFFCTVKTDNSDLQRYLDSLNKNWHITGSYSDQGGAKYTEALDLTGARKVDYTVTGHFGGYMSNNTISFSPDADKIMATEIHDANVNKLPASSDLEHLYQKKVRHRSTVWNDLTWTDMKCKTPV